MKHLAVSIALLSCLGVAPLACQTGGSDAASPLLKNAELGDAQSQFALGRAYEDGKGLLQDDARAVEWFRKSADQGNPQAQNSLGVMYALGRGVSRDREEAMRWYKKAAKQGLDEAMYNIAIAHYNGEGAEENMSLACTWMMLAQRKGDSQAAEALKHIEEALNQRIARCKLGLAVLYERGDEVPQDLPIAVELYKQIGQEPVRKGEMASVFARSAQDKLCHLYFAGEGVTQDYAEAKSWCKKSENSFVYVVMGRMAEHGMGGHKELGKAMEFYRKAAALGVPESFMEAGRLRTESGTHEDEKKAYFWYAIAAKSKYSGAAGKLQVTAAHLNDHEIAEESKRANDWFNARSTSKELKKH